MVHFPIGSGHVRLIYPIQIFSPFRGVEGAHGAFSNGAWAVGGGIFSSQKMTILGVLMSTVYPWTCVGVPVRAQAGWGWV